MTVVNGDACISSLEDRSNLPKDFDRGGGEVGDKCWPVEDSSEVAMANCGLVASSCTTLTIIPAGLLGVVRRNIQSIRPTI